jgi:RNA-directed RNA polymerase
MRQYALEGLKRGLEANGITAKFGPWPSVYDAYSTIWVRLQEAVFQSGDEKLVTDIVNSGEYFTILANNFTNKANLDAIISRLATSTPEILKKMHALDIKFMGDDSEQIYSTTTKLNPQELNKILDNVVDVARLNGLDLNKLKTAMRYYYYEYLKKRAEYGWIVPRIFQLQTMASERVNFRLEFQSVFKVMFPCFLNL